MLSRSIERNYLMRSQLILRRSVSTLRAKDHWNSLISLRKLQGPRGKSESDKILNGTTFIAKDNIATMEEATTCASHMLEGYVSPFDATVITQLQEQGLVLVGKANLDEFGMGSSNTNSHFGPVINPLLTDDEYITGGSSGGSAAAIQANLATFSLGTDTGGSVRFPASCCEVVGFKPTYGRISRWGVLSYAQSLDTVGIFANDVGTVGKVFNVLNKYDSKDPTSLPDTFREKFNGLKPRNESQLVFGIPEEFVFEELSEQSRQHWKHILSAIQDMGHIIKLVSIPSIRKLALAYYTLATAEAASNLSRYDGVRYGYTGDELKDSAQELIAENRSKSFGDEVRRRIILGNYSLSSDSGNHYFRATKVRRKIANEFNNIFNLPNLLLEEITDILDDKCDILVSPTAIGTPSSIKDYLKTNRENFLNGYINDILTVPGSLAGLPAISIPWKTPESKKIAIPIGMQLMAQFGDDESLLRVAKYLMDYNDKV